MEHSCATHNCTRPANQEADKSRTANWQRALDVPVFPNIASLSAEQQLFLKRHDGPDDCPVSDQTKEVEEDGQELSTTCNCANGGHNNGKSGL